MISFVKKFLQGDSKKSTKKERVYLDNAGATRLSDRARKVLVDTLGVYGNPSSIYEEGVQASHHLQQVRKTIGGVINARAHEIYFTASGTESCNLAVLGTYQAWKKDHEYDESIPHIIISSIEHPAVMEVANYLAIHSLANVSYLPVYEDGIVNVEDVKKAITDKTILVSVMYANNEIGTIQPIEKIGRAIDEYKREKKSVYPYFHTDACQGGNYLNLDVFRLKVDMMTVNSSKVYGPKGIAILYKKEGVTILPTTYGGGQERGLRSGTETLSLASAFGEALTETQELRDDECVRLTALRDSLKEMLMKRLPQVVFYGAWGDKRLPNNINCRIPGILSEEMIIRLDAKGFAVSHKSACASQVDDSSYVITALGETTVAAKENIRITLGRDTQEKDLMRLVDAIEEVVKKYAQ